MWEIDNFFQWKSVGIGVLFGLFIALIYEIFKVDRKLFKRSTATVFLGDIAFFIISALISFCLLLVCANGQVRVYLLISEILGFVIFRLTFSKIINLVFKYINKLVNKVRIKYIKLIRWINSIKPSFKIPSKAINGKLKSKYSQKSKKSL